MDVQAELGYSPTHGKPTTKNTLGELLTQLALGDEGLLELTADEQVKLGSELTKKVDSYFYIMEKYQGEIDRIGERIASMQAVKKVLETNKQSLKDLMLFHMKEKGFEKLPGTDFQVAVVHRRSVEYTLISEPDALTLRQWPNFVNRTYTWNLKEIGAAVKLEPEKYLELGKLVEKPYLKISVKKELT